MENATNSNIMKERNRRLIINLIRERSLSRAEISRETSLTKAAVSIIVDVLINSNIVYESKPLETSIGRHPLLLKLYSDFMYAIGINITRNYAEVGIVDANGNILCEAKMDVYPKKDALRNIESSIASMIEKTNIPIQKIQGVGITAPGPVDNDSTTILNPANFDDWHYENVGQRFRSVIHKPIILENISAGLVLCEKYYGIAKKWDDFLLLRVSDGIGAGIMTSGKIFRKPTELGHTSINYEGKPCACGNIGCVEKYASVPSILHGTDYLSWNDVVDSEDNSLIYKEARYLSCVITNTINTFGFDKIILNGEVNYKPEMLIMHMEKLLKKNSFIKSSLNIVAGNDFSGILCAAVSVFDHYYNEYQ